MQEFFFKWNLELLPFNIFQLENVTFPCLGNLHQMYLLVLQIFFFGKFSNKEMCHFPSHFDGNY